MSDILSHMPKSQSIMKELSWIAKTCCNRSRNGAILPEGTQKRNQQTALLFWKGRIDEGERHIITHAGITVDHERTLLVTKTCCNRSRNGTILLEGTQKRRNQQTALLFWKGRIDEGERVIAQHPEITIDHERTLLGYQDLLQTITKRRYSGKHGQRHSGRDG